MNTETSYLQYSVVFATLTFTFYVIPYLLDPYNYRGRFPGPPLAGLTNWWFSRLTRTGHHSEIVQQLHNKYGTFVRLGPNHISIADPDALEIVYGHGSGALKSDFYRIFQSGPETDVFNTSDKVEHSRKRKRLANIFSPQNVVAFEPRVRGHIRELCAQWDFRCKEAANGAAGVNWASMDGRAVMNVCAQFSYLAFDIIGDLALGSPFGLIQAQKDSSLSIESVDASGKPVHGSVEVPVISTLAKAGAGNMAVGVFPSWTHKLLRLLPWNISEAIGVKDLFKLATASVDARIKRGPTKDSEHGQPSIDLIDKLLEAKNEYVPPLDAVVCYDDIKSLPYLNACVKEALRIHSTVGTGLPRVVAPGKTITVAGQTFKAGSVISVPSYTTNRSNVWGNDANEFRPGRWLQDNGGSFSRYFVPFSTGPRSVSTVITHLRYTHGTWFT
ncbi:unnamed protein product [Rhizoctonia solani]|uniref:Benzoate 4-monooxygenase n=1 Tax=Rhizoctonia solani TaxID=456999 RepID=A0A8H3GHY5_9AGAM|nr:unnamed protein product [Rhizoctonia solani]